MIGNIRSRSRVSDAGMVFDEVERRAGSGLLEE
jgi:hypothetical protein